MDKRDMVQSPPLLTVDPTEVIELTRRLVALSSENPPGDEEPVALLLAGFLKEAGLSVSLDLISSGRANLVAELYFGEGPALLFCGHSDTMPVAGTWQYDPHGGQIIEERLYGLGAVDMKGGLAAMAVACATLARAVHSGRLVLRGRLLLAVVIDEENRGTGAKRLVERGLTASWAIIGEPTNNRPVIVSNGQVNFTFTLRGIAGHGSVPWLGHSAILDGVALVEALQRLANQEFPRRSHPLVGPPSLNVGTFQGGTQTSIIPDRCVITLDRRVVPGETTAGAIAEIEEILEQLKLVRPGFNAEVEIRYCMAPVEIGEHSPVVQALRQASHSLVSELPPLEGMRATTDAATLANDGGIPTVVFGPGDIAQAHAPDEYIEVSSLTQAAQIYMLAAVRLLSQGE
jgi:acetylornithine deacetylase/succinyl-diaminopimelate desuccinylase family protein